MSFECFALETCRTYPNGYVPDEQAIFENSLSYRNDGDGWFIHNSRNISLVGGHFADNEVNLDFDRIDLVELHNAAIVGRSTAYEHVVETQNAPNVCNHQNMARGVELHTFMANQRMESTPQAIFENVHISGFGGTGCSDSAFLWLDDEVRIGTFDYFTTLKGLTIDDASPRANFCRAVNLIRTVASSLKAVHPLAHLASSRTSMMKLMPCTTLY
jgi:hypothetical protein